MTREEVRDFLESGVNELVPAVEFGAGLITDFNSIRNHQYPSVWQIDANSNSELLMSGAPVDTWDIELVIAQKDRMDSSPTEYEHIVDDCDEIAQKLVYQYRNIVDGYKMTTMTNVSREPFVKKFADVLSGVTLKFSLISPDKTNLC